MAYTVAVDFDGTLVEHAFPEIGRKIGAGPAIRLLQKTGIKFILYTMRSDDEPDSYPEGSKIVSKKNRKVLQEAIDWCKSEGINLYGVNEHPTQKQWTKSPKCHADLCIDDRNLGCPCTQEGFVDWIKILEWFNNEGFLDGISDKDFDNTIKDIIHERK